MTDNQNRLTRDITLVLCGMFARSNMGLDLPTREEIGWAKTAGITTASASSAAFFCRAFMESKEVVAMFVGKPKLGSSS